MNNYLVRHFLPGMVMIVMLAQTGVTCGAEDLGRLFTSPAERVLLDKLRNPPATADRSRPGEDSTGMEPSPAGDALTIRGLVYRKQGKSTLWISDTHMHAWKLRINAKANDAREIMLKIRDRGSVTGLYPAEMLNTYTNE